MDPKFGRDLHLWSAAAFQQGHRLAFELGRELPSRLRHQTPSPPTRSVSEVSVEPGEDQDHPPVLIAHPNRIGPTIPVREPVARHIREGIQCLDASGFDARQFEAFSVHIAKITVIGIKEKMWHEISSPQTGGSTRVSQSLMPKYSISDVMIFALKHTYFQ
ncbi:hypothetical protein MKL09_00625 [Methylobacterium sp. J-048]|nr:hypothetical protein [Methylobacterium sp. J-048]MCJ2055066.1 hypothetical protein [Methylobacterium sp. J-048]